MSNQSYSEQYLSNFADQPFSYLWEGLYPQNFEYSEFYIK